MSRTFRKLPANGKSYRKLSLKPTLRALDAGQEINKELREEFGLSLGNRAAHRSFPQVYDDVAPAGSWDQTPKMFWPE